MTLDSATTWRRPIDELTAALREDGKDRVVMIGGVPCLDIGLATWRDADGRVRYGRRYASPDLLAQKPWRAADGP